MYNVVLGISGSISAYKSAELCRMMVKLGWNVNVIMTENATRFITPLTMQTLSRHPVAVDQFESIGEWQPNHIALAQCADALVIAPATANVIAKIANGIADDELTSTVLALKEPLIVAPAMNSAMFDNEATQDNLFKLRDRGAIIVAPGFGELACGVEGRGRLADPDDIIDAVEDAMSSDSRKTKGV